MLFPIGCQLDDVASLVTNELQDVEAAGRRVATASVTRKVQARVSRRLERPPLAALISPGLQNGAIGGRDVEIPPVREARRIEVDRYPDIEACCRAENAVARRKGRLGSLTDVIARVAEVIQDVLTRM